MEKFPGEREQISVIDLLVDRREKFLKGKKRTRPFFQEGVRFPSGPEGGFFSKGREGRALIG